MYSILAFYKMCCKFHKKRSATIVSILYLNIAQRERERERVRVPGWVSVVRLLELNSFNQQISFGGSTPLLANHRFN